MTFKPALLVTVSSLALFAAGCSTAPTEQAEAPAKPMLSDAAKAALAEASASVKTAKADYTLWIPAKTAYEKAQKAAEAGDSATVLKESAVVMDLNKLAAEQSSYPSTEAAVQ